MIRKVAIDKKSLFRGYRHPASLKELRRAGTPVEASMKERFHAEKFAGIGVESQDQVSGCYVAEDGDTHVGPSLAAPSPPPPEGMAYTTKTVSLLHWIWIKTPPGDSRERPIGFRGRHP